MSELQLEAIRRAKDISAHFFKHLKRALGSYLFSLIEHETGDYLLICAHDASQRE
jgi:hypothetical protein